MVVGIRSVAICRFTYLVGTHTSVVGRSDQCLRRKGESNGIRFVGRKKMVIWPMKIRSSGSPIPLEWSNQRLQLAQWNLDGALCPLSNERTNGLATCLRCVSEKLVGCFINLFLLTLCWMVWFVLFFFPFIRCRNSEWFGFSRQFDIFMINCGITWYQFTLV